MAWREWAPRPSLKEYVMKTPEKNLSEDLRLLKKIVEWYDLPEHLLNRISRNIAEEIVKGVEQCGVPKEFGRLLLKDPLSGEDVRRWDVIKANYVRKKIFHEKGLHKMLKRAKPLRVEFWDENRNKKGLVDIYAITEPNHVVEVKRWMNTFYDPDGRNPRLGFRGVDACPKADQIFQELREEIKKAADINPQALPRLAQRLIELEKLKKENFIFFNVKDFVVPDPIVTGHYSFIDRRCGFCGQRHRTWIILKEVS